MESQFPKVLRFFTLLWVVTAVGLFVGVFIPPALILPISIATVILLIIVMFSRAARRASKLISILFAFLTGITLFSLLNFYIGALGGNLVLVIFGTSAAIFIVAGLIGYHTKRDLGNWGKFLFITLIGVLIFSIITIFVGFSDIVMVVASGIGVLLFVGYTLYDMNQIARSYISDDEVPLVALDLYLDFINLFTELLKLIYHLKNIFDED
ncbi:Bax inhibitor-1/YccA family protein [Rummeliibacillus suwonensis]|uniref:Bax inhibitor-1/YccA family protein n=1 Tax=Rummeliibacillus suwonensis TaxID=1306154 RepID=UPI001AAF4893|nr:Bax inhibitor-1/YccA family protein [Rummeliibacillus suwonensis]MBO2536100.1 Bax inhibitor-1/YccA family protein [Rummeliibacillus suwonensis]